ncbi:MAG: glycosyltransferase family 4 protein [Pseudomonadota bacterium]
MQSPNLHIALLTDGEPFHGSSPEEQALGGSETACVQMARALAARGHRVQVFCRCPRPGLCQGVVFRDRRDLVQAASEERFDVLVVSRFFAALDLPLQSGLKVLWNHDILDTPLALAQRLERLDLCLVLSRFHAQDYACKLPELNGRLVGTRNGLDLALMDSASLGVRRDPHLITYVSRPERGLRQLLEYVWPRLRQAHPDLTLALCGYGVEQTPLPAAVRREHAQVANLIQNTPGVKVLGPLAKRDYYRHLASCALLLYPCVFPEISCISALEAQALGTPLLTSEAFALSETVVEPRFLVPGSPGSEAYLEAFTERALEFLQHPQEALALAEQAQSVVRPRHDWAAIAAEWEELFLARLGARTQAQAPALAASLLLSGARGAAEALLARPLAMPAEGPAPADPDEAGLLTTLAETLRGVLSNLGQQGPLGVISADEGRTAAALARRLSLPVRELDSEEPPQPQCLAVLVRDRLERSADPGQLLRQAQAWCRPGGYLLLCVASGAWPLLMPGHLARLYDLGSEELLRLLPGRPVCLSFLPRGLVSQGVERYHAGRWLALSPAQGPPPGVLDPDAALRRARPAPPELLAEVKRAGLI